MGKDRRRNRADRETAGKICISRKRRTFMLVMKRLMASISMGCMAAVLANSYISVKDADGGRSFFVSPLEQKDVYEETDIFRELLQKDVMNLTRLAVIKSQVETDGAYDGKKRIDIAEYVNRTDLVSESDADGSVEYYLDDLVRWGDYGFSYQTVYGTLEDFLWYFETGRSREENAVAVAESNISEDISLVKELERIELKRSKQAAGTNNLSMVMISEMPSSLESCLSRAAENGYVITEEDVYAVDILVPRYYSADGADLAEYAGGLEEYVELRNILVNAGQQLYQNFTEYGGFKDQYNLEKSNLRYCYRMAIDGENRYFSNMDADFSGMSEEQITELFQGFGRNLYYNAERFDVKTNTALTSEQMRSILGAYEYTYGEDTRVWIGIDTSYPASDSFAQARYAFMRFMPFYWHTVAMGTVTLIMYVWLLVKLTKYEGRVPADNEEGYVVKIRKGDVFPSELVMVFLIFIPAAVVCLCFTGADLFLANRFESVDNSLDPFLLAAAIAVVAFVADWIASVLYLSLIRRLKLHVFWKNTLIWKTVSLIRRGVIQLYENSNIIIRVLIPFLCVAALNLLMGMIGPFGILGAGLIDILFAIILYVDRKDLKKVVEGTQIIGDGNFEFKIDSENMYGENRMLAEAVNSIGNGIQEAVATSMKDERLKADLITNVSHDIKTPLTSIINFVNLLKRADIQDEKVRGYIDVLDSKSQRLKQLTDDLVEASKISSGNVSLQMERINFVELLNQTVGEFSEKMQDKSLTVMASLPERAVYIEADGRRLWRIVENLFVNVCKYALEGTRVYLDLTVKENEGKKTAVFSMKNISEQPLNIRADELTERFIRGDVSRSTEGSGLGLSIAKNLTELQNGKFDIYLDGDLFKVMLEFPVLEG